MAKDPVLDRTLLQLSDKDALRIRDGLEGIITTASSGGGKSSTVLRQLAMSILNAQMGALVLTVKSDETERWIKMATLAGRLEDVIVFNAESGLSFDFLAYMWQSGGRAAGQIETVAETFTDVMSVGKVYQPSSGEQYFENAVQELLRASLVVLSSANEPISIVTLHNLISSLPGEDDIDSPQWQLSSDCSRVINAVRQREDSLSVSQHEDLDFAVVHLLEKWASLDNRTRSNIESTWSGLSSRFLYAPFRSMFCSGSYDFTPEQITHDKKILIVDVPSLEFGRQSSRICQILIKTVFQRAWTRHPYTPGCCNGAALFQDEFSFLIARNSDPHFHMVARGSGIVPICAVQNICSMAAEEFGEQSPGSKTYGFLGLFGTKIFLANNETLTNQYSADLIGKHYVFVEGWSAGQGQSHHHEGVSGNKQLVHLVEPIEFTRLLKPDGENPLAEGIVHMSGRSFEATKTEANPRGLPYLRVHFTRE